MRSERFLLRVAPFAAARAGRLAMVLPGVGIAEIGPHAVADRYAYPPRLAPFLLCGLARSWWWGRAAAARRARAALVAACIAGCLAVLGALSWMTVRQIAVWKDGKTPWQAVLGKAPSSSIAPANLGTLLFAEGDYEAARGCCLRAAEQRVDATVLNNLAICLVTQKRHDEALRYALASVNANPRQGRAQDTPARSACGRRSTHGRSLPSSRASPATRAGRCKTRSARPSRSSDGEGPRKRAASPRGTSRSAGGTRTAATPCATIGSWAAVPRDRR